MARKAYRIDENDIKGPITDSEEAGFGPENVIVNIERRNADTIYSNKRVSAESCKPQIDSEYISYDNPAAEFADSSNDV